MNMGQEVCLTLLILLHQIWTGQVHLTLIHLGGAEPLASLTASLEILVIVNELGHTLRHLLRNLLDLLDLLIRVGRMLELRVVHHRGAHERSGRVLLLVIDGIRHGRNLGG